MMLWPSTQAKIYNVALTIKRSPSVALHLKMLEIPGLVAIMLAW